MQCHAGFMKQYLAVQGDITAYLGAKRAETKEYSLTVTGHSMGAAIASIAGTALRAQGLSLTVYTYGQPRTGNQKYADYVDLLFPPASESESGQTPTNAMFRATHADDGVAQVPVQKDGYRHHSTEYWIPPPGGDHPVLACTGQEPRDCNQRTRGYPLNHAHFSYFGVSMGDPLNKEAACLE